MKFRDISAFVRESRHDDVRDRAGAWHDLPDDEEVDSLTIGRRIRQLRTERGMTLDELAAAVDRAPSQLSMIENGRREPKLTLLRTIARALGTTLDALLESEPLDERATLEIALERAMRGQTFQALGIPPFRIGKTVPTEALKTMLALQGEIERLRDERAATPEEARRANVALRRADAHAEQLLPRARGAGARAPRARSTTPAVRSRSGQHPTSPRHLGFTLHYVPDLPQTTRSVADIKNGRLYLSSRLTSKGDPRTAVLQALSSRMLGHREPTELRRVPPPARRDELPHRCAADPRGARGAVPAGGEGRPGDLDRGPARCVLGVVRDGRAPLHEPRDGASRHPGALPQGARVGHDHEGVRERRRELPDRSARGDRGADVLPPVDRRGSSSTTTTTSTRTTSTPTPATARTGAPPASSSRARARTRSAVGVRFDDTKWFLGRDTPNRGVSKHSVEVCCRRAPAELEAAWREQLVAERAHPADAAGDAADGRVPGRGHDRRVRVPRGARAALSPGAVTGLSRARGRFDRLSDLRG